MCHRLTHLLDPQPTSVTAGRRFAADAMVIWGLKPTPLDPGSWEDVLLVTSELLSNAVKAASGPILLTIEGHHHRVDVSVVDDNPRPAVPISADIQAPGGRGLMIVAALSTHWGQQPLNERTKEVWAQLPIPAHSPLTVECTLVA